MNIFNAIEKSEIVSIEGDNKSGKLTFTLYLLANAAYGKTVIISSIPKPILKKRIASIESLNDNKINSLLQETDYLCLKENWEEIKAKYGFDFLIEDIKQIIFDTKPLNIVLHRTDLMFNEDESEFAKWFIDSIIELKEEFSLKLFITSKENTIIHNIIENYSDIDFEIRNEKERIIIVKSSLFPLKTLKYKFSLENSKLTLKEINDKITSNTTNSQSQNNNISTEEIKNNKLLVVSQNDYLIKLNQYLFDSIFNIQIAKSFSESIAKIFESPDIVVYNPPENTLNLEMCHVVKDKQIHSKILYLINKDYVRTDDKMQAVYAGCYDIMSINFNIDEYIFLIEKLAKNFFYTEKINQLPHQREVKNLEHFCKIVNNFYDERIYFTLFIGETEEENILKLIRNHDIVYKDHEKTYICFINANTTIFEKGIKNKIKPKNYSLIEAIEWKEKGICK